MKSVSTILTGAFFLIAVNIQAQSINQNWRQDLNKELELFNSCDDNPGLGVSPCNKFMGAALKTVYNIDDFYSKELGRHMLVAEISSFLKNSEKWKVLGPAYEQKALSEAQDLANAKNAVVAVYVNEEGLGHVAIITPGELKLSGIWGIQVPNSASFFPGDKSKSYVNKPLSYSFAGTQIKRVLLYGRSY